MDIDPARIAKRFHDMNDDELLHLGNSGNLTEIAQSLANAELASRGFEVFGSPASPPETLPDEGGFQTIARFHNPLDAQIIKSCLESAGITTLLADANLVQTNSLWAIAVGGVSVLVPSARTGEAKEIIDAYDRGDFTLPDDASFGEQNKA